MRAACVTRCPAGTLKAAIRRRQRASTARGVARWPTVLATTDVLETDTNGS
jgi:hypothetical protein